MKITDDLIFRPKKIDFRNWKEKGKKQYEYNHNLLQSIDNKAKERGLFVGRYITHPCADGCAFYQIIKENKKTITIQCIGGLGDDWVLPAWGERATIDKEYAIREFKSREFWSNNKFGV